MIKNFSKLTVIKALLMFFLAVFFSPIISAQDSSLIKFEQGLNELVYKVSQTVVTIEASEPIYPQNYSGTSQEAIYSLISTGLIYDSCGLVIAPAESVSKYTTIYIRLDDKTVPAKTVAIDYQNGIALLQMQSCKNSPIKIKAHSGCAGQMILAVGNSYGIRASSILGNCAGYRPDGMMQFTALLSPSSQGGGIFSMDGKLIGVITAQIGSNSEIGLALPAYKLPEIVEYLMKNGDRYAGYLGLSTREIEIAPPIKIQMNQTNNQFSMASASSQIEISHGLIVEGVAPNSPAYLSGFKKGDLLFRANGLNIDNPIQFANFVKKSNPGSQISFDFLRHNTIYNVPLTVGKQELMAIESGSPLGSQSDMLVDSILKEIQQMRQNMNAMEERLKQIQ